MSEYKKAIVVYLDDNPKIDVEFSWLWKTWKLYSLEEEFDLVVYHPKEAKKRVSKYYGIYTIEMPNIRMSHNYKFLNSHYFCLPEWSKPLEKYKNIFKTDCDVFLTEHIKNYTPSKLLVGQGGYYQLEETQKIDYIKSLSKDIGYIYRNMPLVGASMFGNTNYITSIVSKQAILTEDILEKYSKTKEFTDAGFHNGISSMIAGELVVNDLLSHQYINLYCIDSKCWETTKLGKDVIHIHAWHTDQKWSKHAFFRGEYNDWKVDIKDAFKNAANYCQFIAKLSIDDLNIYKEMYAKGELPINYDY